MAETKSEKVDRLIADGRVVHQLTLPDGGSVWRVSGDSDTTRRVVVEASGEEWSCDCPYRYPDCSHAWAVLRVMDLEPGAGFDEEDTPRPVLDVHLPVEQVDTDPVTVDDDPADVEPSGVEVDLVEVLEPGGDVVVPDPEQRRDLIDIAAAPVTWRTLEKLAETEFVPGALRGRAGAVLGAVLLGREYGLGPLESLRNIDVIDGTPGPNAELQLRLYRRAGHSVIVEEATDRAVTLVGKRGDTGDTVKVSYTIEDAVRAGLVTVGDNGQPKARSARGNPMPWELHTPDMLWARAVTRLVRRLAPDCYDQAFR